MSMGIEEFMARRTPPPYEMSVEEIVELTNIDPRIPKNRGTLEGKLRRLAPGDPVRPLIEAMLTVPVDSNRPAEFDNPTRVRQVGDAGRGDLSPSDLAWLQRLPAELDPVTMDREDVAALAEMWARASSASDRRLIRSIYEPIQRHYAVEEAKSREATLLQNDPTSFRTPELEQKAASAIAEKIRAATPELREYETVQRANQLLAEHRNQVVAQRTADLAAAREDLEGAKSASLTSSTADSIEAGRARGRVERASRSRSPFEGMRVIGPTPTVSP